MAEEVQKWAARNFGKQEDWNYLLGLAEELGEYIEARGDKDLLKMADALGDQSIYLLNLASRRGIVRLGVPSPPNDAGHVPLLDIRHVFRALGKASHCVLKEYQGIRGITAEQTTASIRDLWQTWLRWATGQASLYGMPTILGIANEVWSLVSRRDWRIDPKGGASEKQEGQAGRGWISVRQEVYDKIAEYARDRGLGIGEAVEAILSDPVGQSHPTGRCDHADRPGWRARRRGPRARRTARGGAG